MTAILKYVSNNIFPLLRYSYSLIHKYMKEALDLIFMFFLKGSLFKTHNQNVMNTFTFLE